MGSIKSKIRGKDAGKDAGKDIAEKNVAEFTYDSNGKIFINNRYYDDYDRIYASTIKLSFSDLSIITQKAFRVHCDGLIDQSHINRYEMMEFIDNFKTSDVAWNNFATTVFNCRPYQKSYQTSF